MSPRDPLDSFEDSLFRAARRERTQTGALERTANAVVAAHRQRRWRRTVLAVAGTIALAAAAALVLRSGPSVEPIQAEHIAPKHSVSSVAATAPVPEPLSEPEPARPSPDSSAAASSSATKPLRSGLAPSVAATTREEELIMLDRARSELASGNANSALSLLDRYDRVSGGHLTAEATLLRIQALSSSGRSSLAAKLARRFVDSDPNSPLADRARGYIPEPPLNDPSAR